MSAPGASAWPPPIAVTLVMANGVAPWGVSSVLGPAGISVREQATSPDELAEGSGQPPPDAFVVLGGRSLQVRNATVRTLVRLDEAVPVVLVMPADSPRGVRSALEAGASGVLFQSEMRDALSACLHAVVAGQLVIPPVARFQVSSPTLSRREKEVLSLVVRGLTNSQIAERLSLSESTVKSHLSSAFPKIGVRSRNEATKVILDPREHLSSSVLGLGDNAR